MVGADLYGDQAEDVLDALPDLADQVRTELIA